MTGWYTRPVFFVTDLERAIGFYGDSLGFREAWRHEEGGKPIVAQMNFAGCEIVLAIDEARAGASRVFVSLEAHELERLRALIAERDLPTGQGWWGYPVIEIRDPDGNELFFPVEENDA